MTQEIYFQEGEFVIEFPTSLPGPAGQDGQDGTDGGYTSPSEQSITDGGNVPIPSGKRFMGLGVRSAVGARTLNLGTTPGGTDLLEAQDLRAGIHEDILVRKYFPDGGTLYFSGAGTILARVYLL
jgi:hypothetical protein